jgi:hypothetical protein
MTKRLLPKERQFEKVDRAVMHAAAAIENAVATMLSATMPLERVARDHVIERLIETLLARNPNAMDYLNAQFGEGNMRLANALMDWRDMRGRR